MKDCIFCRIIDKSINANIIYEDEEIIAFYDKYPKAQIHFLIIPKFHIDSMLDLKDEHTKLVGKALIMANKLAIKEGLMGYKVQINTGTKGGQEIFHLHIHILGTI